MAILLLLAVFVFAGCAESKTTMRSPPTVARPSSVGKWGNCSAPVDLRLDRDGRRAQLLADVTYSDTNGVIWLAPKGWVVDGASIPRAFWTVIGGPWEGRYRFASVLHDVACDEKKRPWDAAAEMFYEAMRCGGVREAKAKIMYYAVYKFGPRWPPPGVRSFLPSKLTTLGSKPPTAADVQRIKKFVESTNPTLQQIKEDAAKPVR
jgi:hypothetical protein